VFYKLFSKRKKDEKPNKDKYNEEQVSKCEKNERDKEKDRDKDKDREKDNSNVTKKNKSSFEMTTCISIEVGKKNELCVSRPIEIFLPKEIIFEKEIEEEILQNNNINVENIQIQMPLPRHTRKYSDISEKKKDANFASKNTKRGYREEQDDEDDFQPKLKPLPKDSCNKYKFIILFQIKQMKNLILC
jgi:hypothetical protein